MITRTTYTGCTAPVEYRIVKQENGVGKKRWVVQRSDFLIGCYWRKWDNLTTHRSLARAERRLAKFEAQAAASTWTEAEG